MTRRPTPIAIAVVQRGEEFLIGQRPRGVPLAGLWEFPGGKVEDHESPEEAAIRECLEETGLLVKIIAAYPQHIQQYDHDRLTLFFFACEPLDQNARAQPPYHWVPRSELAKHEFPVGNRELLKLLMEGD